MKVQETGNSGVYGIFDSMNHCLYVGGSVNLDSRRRSHESLLKSGNHENLDLQQFCKEIGFNFLVFKVLMYCNENEVFYYEKLFIKMMAPLCNTAHNFKGKQKPNVNYYNEDYQKVFEAYRGQWVTAEMVVNITGLNRKRVGMMFKVRDIKSQRIGVNRTVRYKIPHH